MRGIEICFESEGRVSGSQLGAHDPTRSNTRDSEQLHWTTAHPTALFYVQEITGFSSRDVFGVRGPRRVDVI
ncbi:hypothetical protein D3C78_1388130 [compost metagenome]